ncbi:hypothetical protein AB0F72_08380 [Actinoplanes sp. NPDC023936]|uniref:hypothetical protein n=1 Tax=Actinoplanes sp. NPDC023936 TaxID=3154910 RepID=UPI0033DA6D01
MNDEAFREAVLQLLTTEQITELARLHDEHIGWHCVARSEGQTCCIDLLMTESG